MLSMNYKKEGRCSGIHTLDRRMCELPCNDPLCERHIRSEFMDKKKIYRNKIRCKKCGDIIESKFRHDFVQCSCGAVSVDGGTDYLARSFPGNLENPEEAYEELSEWEDSNEKI